MSLPALKGCNLVQIDCDKTVMVTFKHDDKFQENSECGFQVNRFYHNDPYGSFLSSLSSTADILSFNKVYKT